jgi:hypothetical protein
MASCTCKVGPRQPLSSNNVSSRHDLVQCNMASSIPLPPRKTHKKYWVLQEPLHLLQFLLEQSTCRPGKSKLNFRGQRDICIPHAGLCTSNPLRWEEEDFTAARQTMSGATRPCINADSVEQISAENNSLRSRREIVQVLAALSTFSAAVSLPRAAEAAAGSSGTTSPSKSDQKAKVFELEGGVKALDVRIGSGPVPQEGETVSDPTMAAYGLLPSPWLLPPPLRCPVPSLFSYQGLLLPATFGAIFTCTLLCFCRPQITALRSSFSQSRGI